VAQSRRGYRFSIDSVLLAHFAHLRGCERVLDLGTGCGIIPLLLAFRHSRLRVWGVELQPDLAALAAANVQANGMQERVVILHGDMRRLAPSMTGGVMDVVTCNPPFRRTGTGRLNPSAQRAAARHEIAIGLPEILKVCRRMLKTRGRLVVIQAAERLAELIGHLRGIGIEPKRLRTVHADAASEAKMVLVEARPGGGPGMKIMPPLCLNEGGAVSAEVRAMLLP
jgi:tRNA1Val (adenine37-N6)-methyltransferase